MLFLSKPPNFKRSCFGVIFCFSGSFSPLNSGLFFQSGSSTMLLLSITFPIPVCLVAHSSCPLVIWGDGGGWGCRGREPGSQSTVLSPLQTFSYWSVAVLQTTSNHTCPRLPKTISTSVILSCSSPSVLIQLSCLSFTGHS